MQEALDFIPARHKPSVVVHTWDLRAWEVEERESEVQGHLCLYSKFKRILRYKRFCIKESKGAREGGKG